MDGTFTRPCCVRWVSSESPRLSSWEEQARDFKPVECCCNCHARNGDARAFQSLSCLNCFAAVKNIRIWPFPIVQGTSNWEAHSIQQEDGSGWNSLMEREIRRGERRRNNCMRFMKGIARGLSMRHSSLTFMQGRATLQPSG